MAFLAVCSGTRGFAATSDYSAVDAIFSRYCLDCHAAPDPEANLVLESFETLMKGGEHGAAVVPGKSQESRLVSMVEGRVEGKEGKKLIMPPGKRKRLELAEIEVIRGWIDAGARPPAIAKSPIAQVVTPKIKPLIPPRRAIKALAAAPATKLIALARYGEVELRSAETRGTVRTLSGHRGSVNALVFSADGKQLFAAGGEAGLFGEARQWNTADGSLLRTLEGHRDAIYAVALSPDGKVLATGSYDQTIKLWDVATGKELRTLTGHNGAIFDLAFRADGKILASASADRTVKLWDVASGSRRDTLGQSLKELYTVAFSPDGRRLAAGGVDNRIRVWEISEKAEETTNPLLISKFAHEGSILKLVYSADGKWVGSTADDRSVKLWDAADLTPRATLEPQPDWAPGLAFVADTKQLVVGRLDGTLGVYNVADGKPVASPKPTLTAVTPRGIQRGVETELTLRGSSLATVTTVKFSHPQLQAELLRGPTENEESLRIKVHGPKDLPRGAYELWLMNAGGESARLKLYVDDLPQFSSAAHRDSDESAKAVALPADFWGLIDQPGQIDRWDFQARADETIVFDLMAATAGSKLKAALAVTDAEGKTLATESNLGGDDPLMTFRAPVAGRYRVLVSDVMQTASAEHFYRLSAGAFPFVTGCYPLGVAARGSRQVELIGNNLPHGATAHFLANEPGEMTIPIDAEKYRSRRGFKASVSERPEATEAEPNDTPARANAIVVPGAVNGRLMSASKDSSADADCFRFNSKKGQTWIIETDAAGHGSPADTKLEVLDEGGKPIERLWLQAVRDSHITFRGIDSTTTDCRVENWQEMELNQFLYLQGEVVRIFRMPQGPDSGFVFYSRNGKRRAFFDTTATAHANDEPCYIVEPHAPGTKLTANGLPVFHLHYENDDDGERKLGSDSRITFRAPDDGAYVIRVTDSRGYSGERFVYRLIVREAKPDFRVTFNGANPTINAGSGQSFSVSAERLDGFEGEIRLDIGGLPPGLSVSTPLVIEAGHDSASGTINAAADVQTPNNTNAVTSTITARAMIGSVWITNQVGSFGKITIAGKPKLQVALDPNSSQDNSARAAAPWSELPVITIAPGQTVPAWLRVKRNGYDDLITFTVENLPHGVIVDNIGLNGVLIPKGESERQIFFTAAAWVPETERLCYAIENQAGRQTSLPVVLRVRRPDPGRAARVN